MAVTERAKGDMAGLEREAGGGNMHSKISLSVMFRVGGSL